MDLGNNSSMNGHWSTDDNRHGTSRRPRTTFTWSPALLNVVGLLILAFLMGGSSRPDVWSLPVLRPLAVLSLFYGLWSLSWDDLAQHRFLFGMAAAVAILIAIHLIPLPPFIWTALPGRDVIVAIDDAAGLTGVWRPISMAPDFTRNALFASSVPLAILTNGVRLSSAEHRIAMIVVLLGGAFAIVLGALQVAGGGDAFYLYQRSSIGMPAGIFANRNHQALLLAAMLPLLGFIWADRNRSRRIVKAMRFLSIGGVLVVIAFVVILGSRAGLAAGLIGLVSFGMIAFGSNGSGQRRIIRRPQLALGVAIATIAGAIIAAAILMGSAESIQRAAQSSEGEELRYVIWPIIAHSFLRFMPLGTGIGAYERVFRSIEPDAILRPTYSNHAHNDWLEVAWTGGFPAIILMGIAVAAFFVAALRVLSLPAGSGRNAGWAGLVIILLIAIGSVVDYPLRTPVISALFTLSCIWVAASLRLSWNDSKTMSDKRNRYEGRVRP